MHPHVSSTSSSVVTRRSGSSLTNITLAFSRIHLTTASSRCTNTCNMLRASCRARSLDVDDSHPYSTQSPQALSWRPDLLLRTPPIPPMVSLPPLRRRLISRTCSFLLASTSASNRCHVSRHRLQFAIDLVNGSFEGIGRIRRSRKGNGRLHGTRSGGLTTRPSWDGRWVSHERCCADRIQVLSLTYAPARLLNLCLCLSMSVVLAQRAPHPSAAGNRPHPC